MKKRIWFLLYAILPLLASTQTVYGVTGLVKTPTAYTLKSGELATGFAKFADQFQKKYGDKSFRQWTTYVNIGFTSSFEAGIRVVGVPKVPVYDENLPYNYYIDRIINVKFAVLKERKMFPQLAVGIQDAIGTRIFNATYLVASKKIDWVKQVACKVSLGYGTKLIEYIFDTPDNYRLLGFFGGVEVDIAHRVAFMIEHDSKKVNAGIRLNPKKWLSVFGYYTSLKDWGGGVSLNFKI
jgi:hypothetical protein